MLRDQYKVMTKSYSLAIHQTDNYDISLENSELPDTPFRIVEGVDLVVNDLNYNIDSLGLQNNDNLAVYVYNRNNSLIFKDKPFKPFINIDKEACIEVIGEPFNITAYPFLQLAVEGILTNNNDCVFNYLGHTSDGFYFYVENDIIYELKGTILTIDGIIKNTNCPLNKHIKVYGIFNTVPINMKVLGNLNTMLKNNSTNLYKLKYKPTDLQYTVTTLQEGRFDLVNEVYRPAEYLLNVKVNSFAKVVGESILVDGIRYVADSVIPLQKNKNYNIKEGNYFFDFVEDSENYNKDYSALLTNQVNNYYRVDLSLESETVTTIDNISVPRLIEYNATTGFIIFYTDGAGQITGKDEIYFFANPVLAP